MDSALSPLFAIQPGSLLEVMSHPQPVYFFSSSFPRLFFILPTARMATLCERREARRWEWGADEVMGEKEKGEKGGGAR